MKILDQYGKPFDTRELKEPQTARIAPLQNDRIQSQLDGLTPARAARILREADDGNIIAQHQLFSDMYDRDAHLRCEYDKRAGAVLTLGWRIVPPGEPSKAEQDAADWVTGIIKDALDDFEDVILAMMTGVGHGFAGIEMEWRPIGKDLIPRFFPRPQTWFTTDRQRSQLRLNDGTPDGAELIPMNWIMHEHGKAATGYIGRLGLSRCLVWPFVYKAYGIGDFSELLDGYGLPSVFGKYQPTATKEEKDSLWRAVASLAHDRRAILPEGMAIEIRDAATSGGASGLHMTMVDWADRAESKAILGQTLSAEARATGLGSGVADLQKEVRFDILSADARQVAGTLTRDLVYPLIALNLGGIDGLRRCPRFEFDLRQTKDIGEMAESLPKLAAVGMRIKRSWAHEMLGIPEADSEDDVLSVPRADMVVSPALRQQTQTAAASRGWAALARATPQTSADPVAPLLPVAIAAGQPAVDDWVARITAMMDQNPDMPLADLSQALLSIYPDLPTADLVEMMSQLYQLQTLAGMSAVLDEGD